MIIFISSHQPGETLEGQFLPWVQSFLPFIRDFNFAHVISYFVLALTIYAALGPRWMHLRGRLLCVVLCLLYGITDEIHQMFVPGRTPDLADLRSDVYGAAAAMLIVSWRPVHQVFRRLLGGKKY